MKEIVINTCFGGFGLSAKARRYLAKLKGKELWFYRYNYRTKKYVRSDLDDDYADAYTKNFGKKVAEDEIDNAYRFNERKIARDDPDLIKTVEELEEEANGTSASLAIVGIPDDVDWEIEEYDGRERVSERHRTWGCLW